MRADKDKKGNTITGSLKKKVKKYVEKMNTDDLHKAILFKMKYNSYEDYELEKPLNITLKKMPNELPALVSIKYGFGGPSFNLSTACASSAYALAVGKQFIENGTCDITVTIPSNFPAADLDNISASELVVAVSISTAAIISPMGGSPALGTPADWSVPHKYMVEAADKSKKEWTITVDLVK